MQTNVTTEQLRAWADQLLLQRSALRRSLPGLNLFPRFVDCDGPRLQLELAFDTKPWMSNPMGVVHGGVTAILMDTAMGILCCCLCASSTPTITMTWTENGVSWYGSYDAASQLNTSGSTYPYVVIGEAFAEV